MGQIKRGALIVLEGVDRSGKSTQCKKLVQSLQDLDIKAKLMSFPDRSTLTGKLIDEYLKNKECKLNDHAIHLLFSANRWENVDNMQALLKEGVTLIVDRYSYSGIVFSAVKKNMDVNWCKQPEIGLPKPDLVFLLKLDENEMSLRPGFGTERYENYEMQHKVSEMFMEVYKESDNWCLVDAGRSVEEVHGELLQKCREKIDSVKTKPVGFLDFPKVKKVSDIQSDINMAS